MCLTLSIVFLICFIKILLGRIFATNNIYFLHRYFPFICTYITYVYVYILRIQLTIYENTALMKGLGPKQVWSHLSHQCRDQPSVTGSSKPTLPLASPFHPQIIHIIKISWWRMNEWRTRPTWKTISSQGNKVLS